MDVIDLKLAPVVPVGCASPTIQELIASQGVQPLRTISELAGLIGDDEIGDFVASIYAARYAARDRV
jgi:hypothetical protein